jgi:hypothetical protein
MCKFLHFEASVFPNRERYLPFRFVTFGTPARPTFGTLSAFTSNRSGCIVCKDTETHREVTAC